MIPLALGCEFVSCLWVGKFLNIAEIVGTKQVNLICPLWSFGDMGANETQRGLTVIRAFAIEW